MTFHPESIRVMTRWHVVDAATGAVAVSADAIMETAVLERRRPVDVAKREAKHLVNVEAGDAPVRAERAPATPEGGA